MYQNVTSLIQTVGTTITTAYCVYNIVTSIQAIRQAKNTTQTISNTQYVTYYHQTKNNYLKGGTGYSSFEQAKKALGSAGTDKAWHHIVEQHSDNIAKFGAENIHNTGNLVKVPSGYQGSLHSKITGFYKSKQFEITGSTTQSVRQWLSTQSFDFQYKFGVEKLLQFAKELGVTVILP